MWWLMAVALADDVTLRQAWTAGETWSVVDQWRLPDGQEGVARSTWHVLDDDGALSVHLDDVTPVRGRPWGAVLGPTSWTVSVQGRDAAGAVGPEGGDVTLMALMAPPPAALIARGLLAWDGQTLTAPFEQAADASLTAGGVVETGEITRTLRRLPTCPDTGVVGRCAELSVAVRTEAWARVETWVVDVDTLRPASLTVVAWSGDDVLQGWRSLRFVTTTPVPPAPPPAG